MRPSTSAVPLTRNIVNRLSGRFRTSSLPVITGSHGITPLKPNFLQYRKQKRTEAESNRSPIMISISRDYHTIVQTEICSTKSSETVA